MSDTWQQTSLIMLRTMLDDADCAANEYTASRLLDLLVTAGFFVLRDIALDTEYTIDIENYTITPDPMTTTDGQDLIALMVLKAACLADEGKFRSAALQSGVTARCGSAVLQVSGDHGRLLLSLLQNGPCKVYETMKKEYNFGYKGTNILRAVMTPFVSNEFDPQGL